MIPLGIIRRLMAALQQPSSEWCWPLRRWDDREPSISDGFDPKGRKGRGHWGADLMYRRREKGAFECPYRSPWYEMPAGALAHAIGPGSVMRVAAHPNGLSVYVRHGEVLGYRDLVLVYRHLRDVLVAQGDGVLGARPLGTIDRDRRKDPRALNHLHLEAWERGRVIRPDVGRFDKRHGVDPAKLLRRLEHWG